MLECGANNYGTAVMEAMGGDKNDITDLIMGFISEKNIYDQKIEYLVKENYLWKEHGRWDMDGVI